MDGYGLMMKNWRPLETFPSSLYTAGLCYQSRRCLYSDCSVAIDTLRYVGGANGSWIRFVLHRRRRSTNTLVFSHRWIDFVNTERREAVWSSFMMNPCAMYSETNLKMFPFARGSLAFRYGPRSLRTTYWNLWTNRLGSIRAARTIIIILLFFISLYYYFSFYVSFIL